MAKNWTQKLKRAKDEHGATIVCSVAPYRDEEVVLRPRFDYDKSPWILARFADKDLTPAEARYYRYTGRECHPVFPK